MTNAIVDIGVGSRMSRLTVLAVFMGSALLQPLSGSAAPAPVMVTPLKFELVDNLTGGPDDAASLAVQNSSEWEKFWTTIDPRTSRQVGQKLPNPAPAVDFSSHSNPRADDGPRALSSPAPTDVPVS